MEKLVGLPGLKGHMRYNNVPQRELAEAVGLTLSSLNAKLNGKSNFSSPEMIAIGEHLGLNGDQMLRYFFPDFLA